MKYLFFHRPPHKKKYETHDKDPRAEQVKFGFVLTKYSTIIRVCTPYPHDSAIHYLHPNTLKILDYQFGDKKICFTLHKTPLKSRGASPKNEGSWEREEYFHKFCPGLVS